MKKLLILGALICVIGAGILAYGLYVALRPSPICLPNGTGCGPARLVTHP